MERDVWVCCQCNCLGVLVEHVSKLVERVSGCADNGYVGVCWWRMCLSVLVEHVSRCAGGACVWVCWWIMCLSELVEDASG